SSLRAPRHAACCRRVWRAGSMVRHAPIHRRSGHSDIAICCGRNVRGSSPSTSVVPLSNQVTTLNHKRFKGFKMFSDGHSEFLERVMRFPMTCGVRSLTDEVMGFLLYSHESPVRYTECAVTFTNLRSYSFGDGADLSQRSGERHQAPEAARGRECAAEEAGCGA